MEGRPRPMFPTEFRARRRARMFRPKSRPRVRNRPPAARSTAARVSAAPTSAHARERDPVLDTRSRASACARAHVGVSDGRVPGSAGRAHRDSPRGAISKRLAALRDSQRWSRKPPHSMPDVRLLQAEEGSSCRSNRWVEVNSLARTGGAPARATPAPHPATAVKNWGRDELQKFFPSSQVRNGPL